MHQYVKRNARQTQTLGIESPATNMAKIYLDLIHGPKDNLDFYLIAHLKQDDRMRDAYIEEPFKCLTDKFICQPF